MYWFLLIIGVERLLMILVVQCDCVLLIEDSEVRKGFSIDTVEGYFLLIAKLGLSAIRKDDQTSDDIKKVLSCNLILYKLI